MTKNENKIPREEATKLIRVVLLVPPLWDTNPKILRDKTGKTQGIRFSIIPPIKAKPRINESEFLISDKACENGGPVETK